MCTSIFFQIICISDTVIHAWTPVLTPYIFCPSLATIAVGNPILPTYRSILQGTEIRFSSARALSLALDIATSCFTGVAVRHPISPTHRVIQGETDSI